MRTFRIYVSEQGKHNKWEQVSATSFMLASPPQVLDVFSLIEQYERENTAHGQSPESQFNEYGGEA